MSCICGYNGNLIVEHGVPSMRAFVICPNCLTQTDIHKNEYEAMRAWENGAIHHKPDVCRNCGKSEKCNGYPKCLGYRPREEGTRQ